MADRNQTRSASQGRPRSHRIGGGMSLEHRHAILDALQTVLDADHAEAVIEHRRQKKSPLTAFAAKLLAKQFAMCPDPNAAAEEMILRGWRGFKAEWMPKTMMQNSTGNPMIDSLLMRH